VRSSGRVDRLLGLVVALVLDLVVVRLLGLVVVRLQGLIVVGLLGLIVVGLLRLVVSWLHLRGRHVRVVLLLLLTERSILSSIITPSVVIILSITSNSLALGPLSGPLSQTEAITAQDATSNVRDHQYFDTHDDERNDTEQPGLADII